MMDLPIYTLAATGFRYVAVLILALIFLNIFSFSLQEARLHRGEEGLPQVYVGILELRDEQRKLYRFGILQDCIIGRSNRCDITLKDRAMAPIHAHFFLQNGQLYVLPMSKRPVKVNGHPVVGRTPVGEGDVLTLGTTRARVRLLEEVAHGSY